MRRTLKSSMVLAVLLGAAVASAQYSARVTVSSGSSFTVQQLNIRGGELVTEGGQVSTALSSIRSIDFSFTGLGLQMCEELFRAGKYRQLGALLDQYVTPVEQYAHLPGNLGEYLLWQLRVQYWNQEKSAVTETLRRIRKVGRIELLEQANLYYALMLIDQGRAADAKAIFAGISDTAKIPAALKAYYEAQMAMSYGEYRSAMRHVAQIIAFHSRDPEWLPPATVLEAQIYQEMGQTKKAEIVANELIMAYPGSQWSRQGEELIKEATGKRGG